MAHWPKTARGKLLTSLIAVAAAASVWMFVAAMWGPAWASVAILTLAPIGLIIWHHMVRTTRARARALEINGGFSFADVVKRMRAHDSLARAEEIERIAKRPSVASA